MLDLPDDKQPEYLEIITELMTSLVQLENNCFRLINFVFDQRMVQANKENQ